MKKITYFVVGIVLVAVSSSVLSGAVELHNMISTNIQRINAFPEYGSLIVLGTLLMISASVLRRRKAARSR